MSIERISLSAAAAAIAAARRSAADHTHARRVGPPQYSGEFDSKIRDAESSARAARITERLSELQESRRMGGHQCAGGCAGSCEQGRQPCEHRPRAVQLHRVTAIDFAPTEPMGYEAGDRIELANGQTRSAADVYRQPSVQRAEHIQRICAALMRAAYWIGAPLALACFYALARN